MADVKPMSWLVILLIMLGVSLVSGFLFMGVGGELGLSYTWGSWLYAMVLGATAAVLITRRRVAIERQKAAEKKDAP